MKKDNAQINLFYKLTFSKHLEENRGRMQEESTQQKTEIFRKNFATCTVLMHARTHAVIGLHSALLVYY